MGWVNWICTSYRSLCTSCEINIGSPFSLWDEEHAPQEDEGLYQYPLPLALRSSFKRRGEEYIPQDYECVLVTID